MCRAKPQTTENNQASLGCKNLVLAPSHTTSGETSIRTPWTIAERDSSIEIFLAKSPLNMGQAFTIQQMVLLLRPRFA